MSSLPKIAPANFSPCWQLLRSVLTFAMLLLAGFALTDPRGHKAGPNLVAPATGLCSGDCLTCGCAPEMAASGNCCCTLSRQMRALAKNDPTFVAVSDSGKVVAKGERRFFCRLPCGRLPAAELVEKTSMMPLPWPAGGSFLLFVAPSVLVWRSHPDRVPQSLATPPDPPPPEGSG